MFWKMTNLQLKKGYTCVPYGDSAPFLEQVIYQNNDIKRNKKVHYLLIHLRKIDKEIFL